MVTKGMVKDSTSKVLKVSDFRIILKSDLIINGPTTMLSTLPAELKALIRTAFLDAAKNDKAAFDRIMDGKARPWEAVDNAAYDETVKLVQFVDSMRKKNG